jgi:sulfite reductase (NADPH) flavoprotein alpha-component
MTIVSRLSSPTSTERTLSAPPSPAPKASGLVSQNVFKNPRVQPSSIIEFIASSASSTVYVYDVAEHVGFGLLTQTWTTFREDMASVVNLQTRVGAGLSLVGRLSQGTSQDTVKGAVLTAFTTPTGLSVMAEALSYLPPASSDSRLVLQVPTVIPVGESHAFSPSLAPLASVISTLSSNIVVVLSATPQEAVDLTSLSYSLTNSHVIHLFDHYSSCREIGHVTAPPISLCSDNLSFLEAMAMAEYTPFDYFGDRRAHTVVVLLNGPLALAATTIATRAPGLGIIIVRVLRPWQESLLLQLLPPTVKHVHVLDDVPNVSTQGCLYVDVFSSLLNFGAGLRVHGHRIVPEKTQEYLSKPASFTQFISGFTLTTIPVSFESRKTKKLLFFSNAKSPLSVLPHIIQDTFIRNQAILTRLLTDYDVCSKSDTITVDRMLLLQDADHIPIPLAIPLNVDADGESDFLGVFDHTLLTSHAILQHAKPGSEILVVTPWSAVEFAANVPAEVLSLAVEKNLRVLLIDAKDISAKLVDSSGPIYDAMYTLIVHLAFLRLYLGATVSELLVFKAARFMFEDDIKGVELTKITGHAWAGLVEVELPADKFRVAAPAKSTLRNYEFNAITPVHGKRDHSTSPVGLGTWHDAARHILFPSVYIPPIPASDELYLRHPALRPEIPDRTFLVTCTVNRRLTPLEYDRNVFHLEFDTTGTGLKYAIGEALGVHGWNDEEDVLAFCLWYGVDPERLITIPIPGSEDKVHTRTVLQALQQQIDLFGRPPKSFYSDLSAYATSLTDKLALQFIGSPEGSATFKKLAEVDTVTFAEVLALYPSARPGIATLCEMVGDIKPRHYSIASAQDFVGDRVDLLVVSVEWMAPNGE